MGGNIYIEKCGLGIRGTIVPCDLQIKIGKASITFDGIKEMEESKLMAELWDVVLQIDGIMKKSKFVRTNKDGNIVSVLHRESI